LKERLAGRDEPETLAEEAGREGLARTQLADRAWWTRLGPATKVHLRDGDVPRRMPAQFVHGRTQGPAWEPESRHGRPDERAPAPDPQLRSLVVPGLCRPRLRLGPRQPLDVGQA